MTDVPISINPAIDGSLGIISDNADIGIYVAQKAIMNLVLEYCPNCTVHVFDPRNFGANLDCISRLPKRLKSNRVSIDANEVHEFIKMARQRIAAVNQDVLGGKISETCLANFLDNNPNSPERIYILLIEGFPSFFDKNSTDKLVDVLRRGPDAGVYTLVHFDADFQLDDELILKVCPYLNTLVINDTTTYLLPRVINYKTRVLHFSTKEILNQDLQLLSSQIIDKTHTETGKSIKISSDIFCEKLSTVDGIKIAVGQSGNDIQWFELSGDKNTFHALVGGATGSGKTVFLHNIIIHGAASYDPDELQFCLLDFKEGTEFQFYQELPHVRILSMEADTSFGVDFLKFINSFIVKRGALFKRLKVSNYSDARKVYEMALPRILIIIDEFQVLLSRQSKSAPECADLLDDIAKRGRSFGVHLVLCSQSLAGIPLSSATLAQIPLRIALRLSKNDSERFLSDGNTEPALFSRRGQAIMNPDYGIKSGNEYFNVSYAEYKDIAKLNILDCKKLSEDEQPIPHKIYDPTVPLSWDDVTSTTPKNVVRLGKSLSFREDSYATIKLFQSSSYGAFLCSTEPNEINSYLRHIVNSLPKDVVTIIVSDSSYSDVISEKCVPVESHNELHKALQTYEHHHILLLVPDATTCTAFQASGYGKSEISSLLNSLLVEKSSTRFQMVIGARNRSRLGTFIDLRSLSNELKARIVLRLGTYMEQEFGLQSKLSLRDNTAVLLGEEIADNFELFQKFEEALPTSE